MDLIDTLGAHMLSLGSRPDDDQRGAYNLAYRVISLHDDHHYASLPAVYEGTENILEVFTKF